MSTLPFQGVVIFRTFVPDSGFGTYVDREQSLEEMGMVENAGMGTGYGYRVWVPGMGTG